VVFFMTSKEMNYTIIAILMVIFYTCNGVSKKGHFITIIGPISHPNSSSPKTNYIQIVNPSSIPHSFVIPSNHNCFWENFHLSSKQWFHPPHFGLNSSNVRLYVLSSRLKAHVITLLTFQKGSKEDNSRKMWGSTIHVQYKMEHFPFGWWGIVNGCNSKDLYLINKQIDTLGSLIQMQ
jgi:hypothetical protein